MKEKLLKILEEAKSNKHEYNVKQYPDVYNWVFNQTKFLDVSSTFLERLYCVINDTKPYCNQKFTQNLNKGYAFCGIVSKCECAKKNHSEKVSSGLLNRTPDQIKSSNKKRKKTCLEKYGVEFSSQSKSIKDKKEKTCLEKYGVKTNLQHQDTKDKIKETCLEKYGAENPNQSKEILDKRAKTNLEKYGNKCSLHSPESKQLMTERYGVVSPLQSPDFLAKKRKTSLERYGVEHFSNVDKMKETSIKRYNTEFPMQSDEVKKKRISTNIEKYGVPAVKQALFSERAREILLNEENFKEFVEGKHNSLVSNQLSINSTTVTKYAELYGVKLARPAGSKWEIIIAEYLDELNIKYEQNTKGIISPLELDFYLPDYNVAIEINGNYWHSEIAGNKDKDYHYNKWVKCREQGIDLYSYFEDELINNIDIIKNKIRYLTNKNNKIIGARKILIKEITYKQEAEFLNKYHIQGATKARNKTIGAFHNGELVAVFSWQLKKHYLEITRFACDSKASYPGLFSKMMKHMIRELSYTGDIVSFSNNGHSNGGVYKAAGFQIDVILKGAYWYTSDYIVRENRQNYMKNKIAKRFGIDMSNKTEWQAMQELGYDRIWDSGKIKWLKKS